MAKQNVSFIEREIEKIVAGVAGAVLLFVLVTNLVMSPRTAEVGGQSLPPASFYNEVASESEQARERMRAARPDPQVDAQTEKEINALLNPSGQAAPLTLPVAAVPPGAPLEDIEGAPAPTVFGAKVELAEILPPTQPVLSTGRAAARLPVPYVQQVGVASDGTGRSEELSPTTDVHWVVGAAVFNRKAQRERFVAANYLPDRQDVIVAEVRVERRSQLPNGLWSEPVTVQPYMRERTVGKAVVNLVPDGTDYALTETDNTYIGEFRQILASNQGQEKVLRPVFQSYLADTDPREDDRFEWQLPKSLKAEDGTEIDLTDPELGIEFRDDAEKGRSVHLAAGAGADGGYRAGGRGPGVRPGGESAGGRTGGVAPAVWARDTLKQAKEAIAAGKWTLAQELLQSIVANNDVIEPLKAEPRELLRKHRADFERAADLANRAAPGEVREGIGRDIEPLWFTDVTVKPGETYQYRTSVVLLNQYAGMARFLKNPMDASKLLVQGQWSPWSQAISVPRTKYLFLTNVPPDGGRVGVELVEWTKGDWEKAQTSLLPGEVAVATRGRTVLNYGAVLVSADPTRPFQRRVDVRKGETFRFASEMTGSAVLVNGQGEVEEHFLAEDNDRRADLNRIIQEERKRREAIKPQSGTGTVSPQPPPAPRAPTRGRETDRQPPDRREQGERGARGERGRR